MTDDNSAIKCGSERRIEPVRIKVTDLLDYYGEDEEDNIVNPNNGAEEEPETLIKNDQVEVCSKKLADSGIFSASLNEDRSQKESSSKLLPAGVSATNLSVSTSNPVISTSHLSNPMPVSQSNSVLQSSNPISLLQSSNSIASQSNSVLQPSNLTIEETNSKVEYLNQRAHVPNGIPEPLNATHIHVETPMKHTPLPGSSRPNLCLSNKNLFQTPQSQMRMDLSKSQTPASIFSTWSQNNMITTPKTLSSVLESVGSARTQIDLRFTKEKVGDVNRIRKPLGESKIEYQVPSESAIRTIKSIPPEIPNCRTDFVDSGFKVQETKENVYPNVLTKGKSTEQNQEIHQKVDQKVYSIPEATKPSNIQASVSTNPRKGNFGKQIRVKNTDYFVLGHLGQGMSGEVLRVQDIKTSELRAIKIVNLSRMDKETANGCMEEIRMLHKLQAPCVIKMYDYDIKKPYIFVVMEMGDTDLSKCLKTASGYKKLPITMILHYWIEMLKAVNHIHTNGVIHSDLKPANFLLVQGRLKLIDFGIASNMNGDMTSVVKDTSVGTLNYISPEALNNVDSTDQGCKYKISFKSDVWSLGCILYSMVYGRTPFQHIHQWAKIQAISDPKSKISYSLPSHLDPVPEVLVQVLKMCLQFDPKARPSVAQLLEVPYVPVQKRSREIPIDIMRKIKKSLTEEEWLQFTSIVS